VEERKTIKVDFCDFWGTFKKKSNKYYKTLQKYYNVEFSKHPDFLFYSCFGIDYQKYDAARRRGEQKARDLKRDFNNAVDAAKKSVTKLGPGHQQTNPTSSGDGRKGGQMDREWKNHKWVSRERNQNGKWMYDYGGGTSSGNKPTITNKSGKEVTRGRKPAAKYQERNEFDKAMTKARDAARNTGANLNRAFKDLGSAASDVVSSGANFLNNLFK
jgi:hypothetical protein